LIEAMSNRRGIDDDIAADHRAGENKVTTTLISNKITTTYNT